MPTSDSNSEYNKKQISTSAAEHSVFNNIFDNLQERIRRGEWLPEERLPSIKQLAKEYKVGSGSLREALKSLQSIGLIKIEHGSGVYVLGKNPSTELTNLFLKMGAGLDISLAEARFALEPNLAALAAERATDEELLAIEELSKKMKNDAQKGVDYSDLDMLFHRQIAQAARNPILYQTIETVSQLFIEIRREILSDPEALLRASRYHTLIADALKSRNAEQARSLMHGHMNSMMNEILAAEVRSQGSETQSQ